MPLNRTETRELQERLTSAGFDTLGADGLHGPNTSSALRAYQSEHDLVPDGFGSNEILEHLRQQKA